MTKRLSLPCYTTFLMACLLSSAQAEAPHSKGAVPTFGISAAAASATLSTEEVQNLINSGHAEHVYKQLVPQLSKKINDPTYNYLLGIAALDSNRNAEAIQAFERTLSLEPGNLTARAELARAYLKIGDIDKARQELEIVKNQPSVPQQVRNTMIDVISGIDKVANGGGTIITGYLETGGGYDSNVNTATSSSTMVIPLFAGLGPANLNDDARAADSFFMRNTAHVGISHGINRRTRAFGNATISDNRFFSKHNFDQTEFTARAGATYMLEDRAFLTADVTAHHSLLNDEGYRTMFGPSVSYERQLSDAWRGGAFAQAFILNYPDMDGRDGYRVTGGAGVSRAFPSLWGAGVNFSGYVGTETADEQAFEHLAYNFFGVRAGIEATPVARLTTYATTSLESRNYDREDPLFFKTRDDTQLDFTLGANYRLTEAWTVRGQAGYSYNFSNIDLYEYDRVTTAAYLRYAF